MTEPPPKRGQPGHSEWVAASILEAAATAGVRVADLQRSQFRAVGHGRAPWPTQRDLEACGGYAAIRRIAAAEDDPPPTAELAERRTVATASLYVRRLEREVGDHESRALRLHDALAAAVERTPPRISARTLPPLTVPEVAAAETVALLSDWHLGLAIDPREVPGNRYDWPTAARRIGLLVEQIAQYKPHHRDRSALRLLLGGDMIEGELHGRSPQIDALAQQVDGARQILTSAIDYLRHHYGAIHVACTPGNHGRWVHRGPGRATEQKWDSLITILYRGLEAIFRGCPDVTWSIPRTAYTEWAAPGDVACALTHGDTIVRAGTPGTRLDVSRLVSQVRAWNATRGGRPLRVLCLGHYHVPTITQLDDGTTLIVNGCASGTAPYAQALGVFGSRPVQLIWEATPGHPVGDVRFVQLGAADDRADLEAIVPVPEAIGA